MLLFLLPFAVVIGALCLTGRGSVYASPAPAIAGAAPPRMLPPPGPPSPIAVLSDFVRAGAEPPPMVVQCAIAQAELMGRPDLALVLTRRYVIPALAAGYLG